MGFGKDYLGSEIELDLIEKISQGDRIDKIKLSDFVHEKYVNVALRGERLIRDEIAEFIIPKTIQDKSGDSGHCIRCYNKIELNMEKPLCKKYYTIWNQYKDP